MDARTLTLGALLRNARTLRHRTILDIGKVLDGGDENNIRTTCERILAAETGEQTPSPGLLDDLARILGVSSQESDRWHALAGHVAGDLVQALLDDHESWDAVRALLRRNFRGVKEGM